MTRGRLRLSCCLFLSDMFFFLLAITNVVIAFINSNVWLVISSFTLLIYCPIYFFNSKNLRNIRQNDNLNVSLIYWEGIEEGKLSPRANFLHSGMLCIIHWVAMILITTINIIFL